MSLKRVLETLAALGLNQSDANVYVFLAKNGPYTGKDLCSSLKMSKPCLYQCLKNLESKNVVHATPDRPAIFYAVSFDKVLDILITAKLEEAKRTQQDRDEALAKWQSSIEENFK